MGRLSIFNEDDKIERTYKSSLASLGFRTGITPSSKEIDMAYARRRDYLASTTILDQSYANLQQPIYKYERIYERIQCQYLFKQYDILYRYYNILEKEGLTKDGERLLKSCEDEYEKCINDIRLIEKESNIIAEMITNGIDDDILDSFISGLEKRDIDIEFNIENIELSSKIDDFKKKINALYYKKSSESRLNIKNDFGTKTESFNGIAKKFPSTKRFIEDYLSMQRKTIIEDDVDLTVRRNHLNDVDFIGSFLKHPINGQPNVGLTELRNKHKTIKNKFEYILKLKKIKYIKMFKKKIFMVDNKLYLENLTNFTTVLNRVDDEYALFNTYINIIDLIVSANRITYEDATYVDGLLNGFDSYLNRLNVSDEYGKNIDEVLKHEQNEIDSFLKFKESSINENIKLRYSNLISQIISYYSQAFIPTDSMKNLYKLLHSYKFRIKDNNVSIEEKLAIIDHMENFASIYCSDDIKKDNKVSK